MTDIKLFQPSNGTEGMMFMDHWCANCVKMPHSRDANNQCMIRLRTMAYSPGDKEYPKQWRYEEGKPICTAFKSREEHNAELLITMLCIGLLLLCALLFLKYFPAIAPAVQWIEDLLMEYGR